MSFSKTIFVLILAFASVYSVFGQGKDEFHGAQTDPLKSVEIFPNPATDFLTIKFEYPVADKSKFMLRTIIGNEVNIDVEVVDDYEVRVRVKEIHEGYYFLSIQNGQTGAKSMHKFLKR